MKLLRILKDVFIGNTKPIDDNVLVVDAADEYIVVDSDEFENLLYLLKKELRAHKFIIRSIIRIHEEHNLPANDLVDFIYQTERWFQNHKDGLGMVYKAKSKPSTIHSYFYINHTTNTFVDVGDVLLNSIEMWERMLKSNTLNTPEKREYYLKYLKEDWRAVYELVYDLLYH